MKKAEWYSSHASRARQKGSESNLFSSLSQKGFHKTSWRASGLGEPGGSSGSPPSSGLGAIDTALLRGDEGVSSSSSGRLGLVLQGEELVRPPGAELGLWICDPPEDWSV